MKRTLYHVSPARNVASILRAGLDPRHSTGRRRAVWLVSRWLIGWAINHVCKRHNVEAVVVIRVTVRRRMLRRTRYQGLFYVTTPQQAAEVVQPTWT